MRARLIKESVSSDAIIEIEKNITDERGLKSRITYNVNYLIDTDDFIEITGTLIPYNTGRSTDYKFEPDDFTNEASEEYYDANWEDVNAQILDKFYSLK